MASPKKPARAPVQTGIETSVLVKSARRCMLCFHLSGDFAEKDGQIAHLDHDPSNGSEDNLAWMCMPHHSRYDSTNSQHKNYTISEVKQLREKLYGAVSSGEHYRQAGEGKGGNGGDAKVGGNGRARGGSGGQAGKYGTGGAGGNAVVNGDGEATGGSGGAAADDGIWRPPAKSGYENAQKELGMPVDPFLRQFGRGGAGAGYEPKLAVIKQVRALFFCIHSQEQKTVFEDINAVPTEFLNQQLEKNGEPWRVRIIDDEYEFFIPG